MNTLTIHGAPAHGAWVAMHKMNPAASLRLFCFPHAGAGASSFARWSRLLSRDIDVCPVQLPGRETRLREPAYDRLEPLCAAVVEALARAIDRPFALLGHSMGALLAAAVAHALTRHGLPPAQMFVSAFNAPHLACKRPLHALPEPALIDALRELSGTPQEVLGDREMRALFLPALRADLKVCESYDWPQGAPLHCPLTVFGGRDDPRVSEAELLAWRAHTDGAFTAHLLAGGHFFLYERASEVAAIVQAAIAPSPSVAAGGSPA